MQKQSSEGNVFIPLGPQSLSPSRQPQLVELACMQLEEGLTFRVKKKKNNQKTNQASKWDHHQVFQLDQEVPSS